MQVSENRGIINRYKPVFLRRKKEDFKIRIKTKISLIKELEKDFSTYHRVGSLFLTGCKVNALMTKQYGMYRRCLSIILLGNFDEKKIRLSVS
jgi:hypothetical protein